MNIQIFGKSKCFDTKKAERWFKERRIRYQYIDLARYGMSRGELQSVKNAVGLAALIDEKDPDAPMLQYLAYDADKLEKLAFIREKRFDWFKDRYGMCARDTGKRAQVSVDEANGGTGASMIFPLNMLKARQEFIDQCNRKFGWDASVHFAGAWLGEMERYETTVIENGEIDIDQYDAVKETTDESSGEVSEQSNGADGSDAGSGASENRDDDRKSEETE